MRANDAPAMHDIHTHCVQRLCSASYNAAQIDAWLEGRKPHVYDHAVEARGEKMMVAEITGEIAGFGSWKDGELCNLFVHPDCNGQGIGKALYEACAEGAADEGHALTTVDATLNSRCFYEGLGFRAAEERSRHMRGVAVPVITMKKGEL